ncbi:RraA family protein [Agromyces archimandritae]|uniref:Putative 4-hydroxy-4-methyl-2-oxoglutarate aldolase n=1 Tax=Agromyces archimandritae TaxID=2781962 RepID=A0A975INA4_9MICO|nr:RraA family protein [Agromyces archimandritae]QTX04403.1 RraA family protein [Agromyces archimandritae]
MMIEDIPTRLARLDSAALSDALDAFGLPGAVLGLRGITLPNAAIVGRVRTVQAGPRREGGAQAHIAAALVDEAEEGDVVVIANDARTDVSCWGGLLGRAAVGRGVRGVIVDGAFRDVQENADLGLPVFARAAVPVSARGRIVQISMDDRVTIEGVHVDAGDWVVADRTGIVFVKGIDAERVIDFAERIVARESRMLEAVVAGDAVTDVMHDSRFPAIDEGAFA